MKINVFYLWLIALVLGVAAILGDLSLRLAKINYPYFYQPDKSMGWTLRSGASGYFCKEGRGYVSINSDGLRDIEHSREKPPGVLRVAVSG